MSSSSEEDPLFDAELYEDLKRQAAYWMAGQRRSHTLQATALVNEAYLRLCKKHKDRWTSRGAFISAASRTMRHVLVDHARYRQRQRRKPPGEQEALDQVSIVYEENAIDLLALNEALQKLEQVDPPMVQLVDLHFFGGLSIGECSERLQIPRRTLERKWSHTQAWLFGEIS